MVTRREILSGAAVLAGGAALLDRAREAEAAVAPVPYSPVATPNGKTLPFEMKSGVKEFHLVAEPVKREFTPGLVVNCWGYNGESPGPILEAVEGDRVRILVTNQLPERTAIHWHGVLLPNGMDGVGGLTQPHIPPGETWAYEFTLRQHGTQMYHPHSDETVQMALGMMGFFIIHPKSGEHPKIDRDFAIFLHEWAIRPGTATPDPNVMTDFNYFTMNGRIFPGTDPLVVKRGERVRIRFANLSMDSHPIHIHGHKMIVTGTDGGSIPPTAQWPETTINVPPGTTRQIEFVADALGDWPLHCHKSHHTMNGMEHGLPNVVGVKQEGVEEKIQSVLPGYMAMGESGMGGMQAMQMPGPPNTVPMMSGDGPFGDIEMGGMFTLVKVRERLEDGAGWYRHPEGTLPHKVK
jgi:manganese oxidase